MRAVAGRILTERPAVWSVGTRGVQAGFGLLSVVLVSRRLSPTQQGIFYTYASLLALLAVSEFGLSYAVMQSASHAAAAVRWERGRVLGRSVAVRQLGTLARRARAWLALEMVPVAAGLGVVGGVLLARASERVGAQEVALWLLTLAAGIAWQLTNPIASVLEGAGQVTSVWRLRFLQESAAGVVLCTALAFGSGVASLALSYAARALLGVVLVRTLFERSGLADVDNHAAFRWRTDVWPFQWRIGLSIASGYLLFQSFAPLMLALAGPVAAGQFGMTLAITNGLLAATTAWPTSLAPGYGAQIARRAFDELDAGFGRTVLQSSLLAATGTAVVLGGAAVLRQTGNPLSARLLPPEAFALMVSTALLNHIAITLAIYLRAFQREPLLLPSVIGSVVTVCVMAVCARWSTVTRVAQSYFALTVVGLVMTTSIFVVCRRRWQAEYRDRPPVSTAVGDDGGGGSGGGAVAGVMA